MLTLQIADDFKVDLAKHGIQYSETLVTEEGTGLRGDPFVSGSYSSLHFSAKILMQQGNIVYSQSEYMYSQMLFPRYYAHVIVEQIYSTYTDCNE